MNKILAALVLGVLLAPSAAFAQVNTDALLEQNNQLVQQLIALLMQQVEILQAQLAAMEEANEDEVSASGGSEEVVIEAPAFNPGVTASTSPGLVDFIFDEDVDEANLVLENQSGRKWPSSHRVEDDMISYDDLAPGTYSYTITAIQYGPSGKYAGSMNPGDSVKAVLTGTVEIE